MNKFNHFISLTFTLLCLVPFFFGCGEKKPDGMPKIYPCTITITQENSPLEGASVLLISDDPVLGKWSVAGTTDASGNAVIKTHAKFSGAPAGQYVVVVSKEEYVAEAAAKTDNRDDVTITPQTLYYLVDQKFSQKETSPLKFTMEAKSTKATFDTGKKVREKLTKKQQLEF